MPEDQDPPSVGEQLADALEAAGVSQSELARRLAPSGDETKQESKRRWIAKILKDKIARPGMGPVEQALSLPPGYFRLPTAVQARRRRVRLEELEAELAKLRDDFDRFLRAASGRRVESEEDQEPPTRQEDRPSSPPNNDR